MLRNLVRRIAQFLRAIFPWILRFLRMLFWLSITAVTSIWVGVPQAVTRIANHWATEATGAGLSHNHSRVVRYGGMVVASITLFLGWLVLASLTVFIIRLIL